MQFATTIGALCLAYACAVPAQAMPHIPADGAQVIERLPARNDPLQRELRRLRAALAASPGDPQLAADLARRYIAAARTDGDPRYLGYAQAVLAPWRDRPQAPLQLRVLRATILQSMHQFPAALAELDAVLRVDRNHAQAWLTRATILQVQGDYPQAKSSCAKLYALAPELVSVACIAGVAALNGQAAQGYALLRAVLGRNADADPEIKGWAWTLLAEMAARRGSDSAAEEHFRQALAANGADAYLLGAYADFLLDRNRPREVLALLAERTRNDALLLRYAIALKRLDAPGAGEQIEILRSRFAAAMLREDPLHRREQARFELQLLNHPETALRLAQQNWQVQKEPADARVFLEAAAAAGDRSAARPVLDWLRQTGLQDRALAPLLARLGEAAS